MFRRSDQIVKIDENSLQLATVDVCGVQREVNISLICTRNPADLLGKWVLVHVGFAMSVIDEDEAKKTQEALITMSQLEHEVGDFFRTKSKIKKSRHNAYSLCFYNASIALYCSWIFSNPDWYSACFSRSFAITASGALATKASLLSLFSMRLTSF